MGRGSSRGEPLAPRGSSFEERWRRRGAFAVVAAASVVLAVTRVIARQGSLWEWDDFVFAMALRNFAPAQQVPHPPFYPGYVYLSRLADMALGDATLALTWVSVAASLLALPFLYGVARELLGSRRTALTTTVLFAFFPAVWLHAGVPLSDAAGLAAALGALWLALIAARRPRLLPWAGLAFAVTVSVRPQDALVPLLPLAIATRSASPGRRSWTGGTMVAGIAGLYVAPILAASANWHQLWAVFRYQAGFLLTTDSLAAHGFDVATVVKRYGLDLWGSYPLAGVVWALATVGAVWIWRSKRDLLGTVGLAFLPYAALAWLALSPTTAGRYAIPYLPAVALLVSVGLDRIETKAHLPRGIGAAVVAAAAATVIAPAVLTVHRRPSPPVAAAAALRALTGGQPFQVVYDPSVVVQAAYLFPDVPRAPLPQTPVPGSPPAFYFGPPRRGAPDEPWRTVVAWPDQRLLQRVGRGRYLRTEVGPLVEGVAFGEGFFPGELDRHATTAPETFHWMGQRGVLVLPPAPGSVRVELDIVVPLSRLPGPPEIVVTAGGCALDRFAATSARVHRELVVPGKCRQGAGAITLEIRTSETYVPSKTSGSLDTRRLGLQVRNVRVDPAP